jgi:hypothetical protein
MSEPRASKLNQLEQFLPQGLLVDGAWLDRNGIASNLRHHYVKNGWLEQPTRGVYQRRKGQMTDVSLQWQQVVISLQTLLDYPLIVGGMTALDLHGLAHYLTPNVKAVHLYGRVKAPGWLNKLDLPQLFAIHNSNTLFNEDPIALGLGSLAYDVQKNTARDVTKLTGGGIETLSWGQWEWPLTLSSPERAYLEFLDELPNHASFHNADMIMQGALNFRPKRLEKLLKNCKSIKVKRLFFFFADRHRHAWRKQIDPEAFDLGKGKRMLFKGGRLDPVYQITVPGDLDGQQ